MGDGTRCRRDHVIADNIIENFKQGTQLVGDDSWFLDSANIWIHVTHKDGYALAEPGWTAIIYRGTPICSNYEIIETDPTPDTSPIFPDSFTLTDPSGAKAEYKFVRIIDQL